MLSHFKSCTHTITCCIAFACEMHDCTQISCVHNWVCICHNEGCIKVIVPISILWLIIYEHCTTRSMKSSNRTLYIYTHITCFKEGQFWYTHCGCGTCVEFETLP